MTYSNSAVRSRSRTELVLDVNTLRKEAATLKPPAFAAYIQLLCALWKQQNLLLPYDMPVLARHAGVRLEVMSRYYWPQLRPHFAITTGGKSQYIHHPYLTHAAERHMTKYDRGHLHN